MRNGEIDSVFIVDNPRDIEREMKLSSMEQSISKNLGKLKTNKRFLSLVEKMKVVVFSIAAALSESLPEKSEIRQKTALSLQDKIRQFRLESLPVTKKPHYSA